jgi:hypothetical protein
MNLDEPDIDDAAPNPMEQFIHRAQVAAAVKSAGGASVVLDMPLPPQNDVDDDSAGFWKAPRVIKYQPKASSGTTKFDELVALIRKVFDGHEEECQEVIQIVTEARDQARAEVLARI